MRPYRFAILAMIALGAAGCTSAGSSGSVPSLAFGSLSHSARGSAAGAALVKALNGGIIADDVATRMDPAEREAALKAEYQALENTPAGQKVTWGKPGETFNGEVIPSQPYRVGSQDCRPYSHTVFSDGTAVTGRGTACRNPDGSWTPLT